MQLDLRGLSSLTDGEASTQTQMFLIDNFIWVLLVATTIAFGIINGTQFFNVSNLQFIVFSSVMLGFLVIAEGICLVSGNFDLSVGQAAGFAGMFNAMLLSTWAPWMPWYLGIATILLVGAVIGAVNGYFIAYMDLNPFLVTLGTFFILQYATLELSLNPVSDLPDAYLAIGGDSIAGVPISIFLLVIAGAIIHVLMRHSRFGSNIYSVGGDPEAASRVGISTTRTIFFVFVLSGVLSAFAGLLYTGYLSSATPGMADGDVFLAFAGAVIGGASLSGGRGSVVNMIGGALLIGVLQAGLVQSGASGNQVFIFFGVLVIVAIIINRYREEKRDDLLTPN